MKTMKKIKFSDIQGMLERDGMREIIGGSGGGGTIGSGGGGNGTALNSNPFNSSFGGSNYGGFGGANFGSSGTQSSAPNSTGVFGQNNPYGSSPMGAGTPYVNEQNELLYFAQSVSNGVTLIVNGVKYIYNGLTTIKASDYPGSAGAGQLP